MELLWGRIADAYLFTWGYLGYHVFAMVSMRMFLNANNIIEYLWFWICMLVLEHAFIFGIYALAKRFIRTYTAALVLISAAVIGAVRTYITTSLAIAVGADPGVAWGYQLFLGAFFEVMVVGVWANINGAFREHLTLVRQLNQTKESILGYRENAETMLADEQEKLLSLTQNTLMPQIEQIENALVASDSQLGSRWGLANELKGLINNQVRPLSDSLRQSARALVKPAKLAPNQFFSVVTIPKKFRIQNSLFPKTSSFTMFLTFLATPFWILDISWVVPSSLFTISYFAVLYAIKSSLKNAPKLPNWFGVTALIIIAIVNSLPAYAAAVMFYPDLNAAVLYGLTVLWSSLIVILTFAYLDSLDYEATEYRNLLIEQNQELSTEMALFEQQLWTARKNWSVVIHGTVQAALTAALTRLNAPEVDQKTLKLVKKDLERAISALRQPPVSDIKLTPAIKELVSTWQGVCDIDVAITPEVKKVISRDTRLTTCVNEILKEAVSNAVRHGDARNAWVSIGSGAAGMIDLAVANDGSAPSGRRRGLGSGLMDELTVDWSLGLDKITNRTILRARLPFSIAQA